ncbi:ARMT1-like domain-containing protein [Eubacteriales bacterium OttesenSCG-928-N13]|nr:ARMT1-like domain-containing protein [Eubacteriales bacterium OttesenSCG-928-N13]
MRMSAMCMGCVVRSQTEMLAEIEASERKKSEHMQAILTLIGQRAHDDTPQRLFYLIDQMQIERFGFGEDMSEIKMRYNAHMMKLLPRIAERVKAAPDPLMSAICHAQAGNYIDFATVQVSDDELFELLERAADLSLPMQAYQAFLEDLAGAKTLTYLLDNAGEIVLDKLLMEQILVRFPQIQITAMVRGALTKNDCTIEDAEQVGLYDLVHVVDNGTPLAGTELSCMPRDRRAIVTGADMIISKGQGNCETLSGCGLNIWYMFLCKCDWFVKRLQMPRNTPMFVNERDVDVSLYVDEG